jgi:hypothetical protein
VRRNGGCGVSHAEAVRWHGDRAFGFQNKTCRRGIIETQLQVRTGSKRNRARVSNTLGDVPFVYSSFFGIPTEPRDLYQGERIRRQRKYTWTK